MHDMSNILQSMLMSLEMCEYKIKTLEYFDNLKDIINNFREQINRGANLVNNVRKFSEIQKNRKKLLKIEVIDNGRGFPDFKKDCIFNRGDIKDRSVPGLGLGLSLVKSILDKYNAKIWIIDKVAKDHTQGTKFVLLFPLLQ